MSNRILFRSGALALGALLAFATGALAQQTPPPQAAVTTAVIAAGGGAGEGSFSSVRAIGEMVGNDTLQGELRTLRVKFGSGNVDRFVQVLDFAFIDGWKRAGADDVKMTAASPDTGTALALDIIRAGTGTDRVFRVSTDDGRAMVAAGARTGS